MTTVQAGSFLTLHYRLAGPQGTLINTFEDKPATLSLGSGELSPGMEAALIGLEEGVRTTFELASGVAFGDRNPEMQQWVARKLLAQLGAAQEHYVPGDVVQFPTPDGHGTYAGAVMQVAEDGASSGWIAGAGQRGFFLLRQAQASALTFGPDAPAHPILLR